MAKVFKIKNIMIPIGKDRLAAELVCKFKTPICPAVTIPNCGINNTKWCRFPTIHCNYPTAGCAFQTQCPAITEIPCRIITDGGCGMISPYVELNGIDIYNPEILAELKVQLKDELEMLEAREKLVADAMEPKTMEEVEALEHELTAATKELDDAKKELAKIKSGMGGKRRGK
jgi:hypothetical protein